MNLLLLQNSNRSAVKVLSRDGVEASPEMTLQM